MAIVRNNLAKERMIMAIVRNNPQGNYQTRPQGDMQKRPELAGEPAQGPNQLTIKTPFIGCENVIDKLAKDGWKCQLISQPVGAEVVIVFYK